MKKVQAPTWFKTWSSDVWHQAVASALKGHVSARCGALTDVEPAHVLSEPPPDSECRKCAQDEAQAGTAPGA